MAVNTELFFHGSGVLSIGTSDVGATRDGILVAYTREYFHYGKCDQLTNDVAAETIGEEVTIRTNLLESSLENLAIAFNVAAPVSHKITVGGSSDVTLQSLTWLGDHIFTLNAAKYKRQIKAHKVLCIDSGEYHPAINDVAIVPVTFKCFSDLTKDPGDQILEIEDIVQI